jgi:hypothetical protein
MKIRYAIYGAALLLSFAATAAYSSDAAAACNFWGAWESVPLSATCTCGSTTGYSWIDNGGTPSAVLNVATNFGSAICQAQSSTDVYTGWTNGSTVQAASPSAGVSRCMCKVQF